MRTYLMENAGGGRSQYEYLETLQDCLTGQTRLFLDQYMRKWDWVYV